MGKLTAGFNGFGDFEFSDDDKAKEVELSLIDKEKIKILETIKESADKCIEMIQFKIPEEEKEHFKIISRYTSLICDLNRINNLDELSEEEMEEKIKKIHDSVKEIRYEDLNENQIVEDDSNLVDSLLENILKQADEDFENKNKPKLDDSGWNNDSVSKDTNNDSNNNSDGALDF